MKEIRPLAEHGAVIWSSGLTKSQINDLEKIQKVAFKIILEDSYLSYEVACTLLNVSALNFRRTQLCTTFALKLFSSPRCTEYFTPAHVVSKTRSKHHQLVEEKKCNTKRYFNAPHNFLARLVNLNKAKIENKNKK